MPWPLGGRSGARFGRWPKISKRQSATFVLHGNMENGNYFTPEKGKWCGREDSNFHALRHSDLNAARLPFRHDRTPW